MRSGVELIEELKSKYNGVISFKKICEDEGILAVKARLNEGVNGFYVASNGHRLIVLNETLSYSERRDWGFHELYHHFRSAPGASLHQNKRDEAAADLFAAICRAPLVREGETIDTLMERYNVSRRLAKIRIEFEVKRSNGG